MNHATAWSKESPPFRTEEEVNRSLEATKSPRLLMLRALDLPLRHADPCGLGQLADDDEEGEFVEKFDQSTASMTLEALITA